MKPGIEAGNETGKPIRERGRCLIEGWLIVIPSIIVFVAVIGGGMWAMFGG